MKEAGAVGLISFALPFLACAAVAHWVLGWAVMPSWLAGVALSTTSVAVVYAVMLEFGFNSTSYGKTVLAACFVTDLGTVLALGLIFAPFTVKTLIFLGASIVAMSSAAVANSTLLPSVRGPAIRAGSEVLTAVPVWLRSIGELGR